MPELTALAGDARLLAITDAHLPHCREEKCSECGLRRMLIRRHLDVLDAAGRLPPRVEVTDAT